MENNDNVFAKDLAKTLAKDLFDCGSEINERPYRIAFKGGDFPNEFNMGGFNEECLANFFEDRLKIYLNNVKEEGKT